MSVSKDSSSTNLLNRQKTPPKKENFSFPEKAIIASTDAEKVISIKTEVEKPISSSTEAEKTERITNMLLDELKTRKINHREQKGNIWIYPENISKIDGRNILVPGTKCPAIKNFMGIKVTHDRIYIVESTNRLYFPDEQKLKQSLLRFCNHMNLSKECAHFYLMKLKQKNETKLVINANRVMYIDLKNKENLIADFVEEIITIDKIYQSVLMEHVPPFIFNEYYLKNALGERKAGVNNTSKNIIIKSIKGMGFTQDKKADVSWYNGQFFSVNLAVNVDIGTDEIRTLDWRILPISIDVYEDVILIKIKFCKNKHVVKIEPELTQNLIAQFINYVNMDLKKAQYRFSFSQLTLTFESMLVTKCLDFTEIQYTFQETFAYMIENFKKFGNYFAKIYNETTTAEGKEKKTDFGFNEVKEMYNGLKKGNKFDDSSNYSLFYINSTHKNQVELLIPEGYEEREYKKEDFKKEKKIIDVLKRNISECFHIKVIEDKLKIFYPIYHEGQIFSEFHTPGSKQIGNFEDFLERIYRAGLSITDPLNKISMFKVMRNYFSYFSVFPLFDYVRTRDRKLEFSFNKHLNSITSHILSINNRPLKDEISLTYIEKEAFDNDFSAEIDKEAVLIGQKVKLVPIELSEVSNLQSQQFRNLPNTISLMGFYKENNKHYKIQEKLQTLDYSKLSAKEIRNHIICIIETIMLIRENEEEIILVTEHDLFISNTGGLKIKISSYPSEHMWNCFVSHYTSKQKQVYSLAFLIFKLSCKEDPLDKLKPIPKDKLISQLKNGERFPIFDWEFEKNHPKLVYFLRECWSGKIPCMEEMRKLYPIDST